MGTGWRRAFCTSVRRDPDTSSGGAALAAVEKQSPRPSPSPRSFSKLGGIFSSVGSYPSTPRLQPETAASTPRLHFTTKSSPPDSPKLQCKTTRRACTPPSSTTTTTAAAATSKSSSLFRPASNPSSPISPSRFALFKAALRLSRTRCGICAQSVKTGHGTAVFTAECSHAFHFPCIASHIRNHGGLVCPVCSATWRQAPLLSSVPQTSSLSKAADHLGPQDQYSKGGKGGQRVAADHRKPHIRTNKDEKVCGSDGILAKAYDDDEPLLVSLASGCRGPGGARFNPIPEADDEDDDGVSDGEKEEFRGFFVNHSSSSPSSTASMSGTGLRRRSRAIDCSSLVEVSAVPVVALVSAGRSHHNYVVALKVRVPCPPPPMTSPVPHLDSSRRAPIDLVTVLDVSCNMDGAKLCMLKRAMRLLISSLGPADRLAMVAFSSAAKRLLPLRRMSPQGQRSARQIVDRLVVCAGNQGQGQPTSAGAALRKATKVLDDRRERNPVATIMLLSDGQQQQQQEEEVGDNNGRHHRRYVPNTTGERHSPSGTTRFAHIEIPIHDSGFGEAPRPQKSGDMSSGDAFAKCVGGLLSVVLQDVHLQLVFPVGEVSVVYSCGDGYGRAMTLGGGTAVRLGNLYAEEERELLVELRVSAVAVSCGSHQYPMSIRCSYRDPATQELIRCGEQSLLLPPLRPSANTARLRNLFVTTRAVAESRRLVELRDYATAIHLLSSARSLLLQSSPASTPDDNLLRSLEGELADLQLRRHLNHNSHSSHHRVERREEALLSTTADVGDSSREPLTPTSAWRAAERLAKVAIMRKSLNRVSDLHGFENARF